jgi:hypothetical protein
MWDTGLPEGALGALTRHETLETLNLQGMSLSIEGAQVLSTLPALKALHVGVGRISTEGAAHLRRVRPALKLN